MWSKPSQIQTSSADMPQRMAVSFFVRYDPLKPYEGVLHTSQKQRFSFVTGGCVSRTMLGLRTLVISYKIDSK